MNFIWGGPYFLFAEQEIPTKTAGNHEKEKYHFALQGFSKSILPVFALSLYMSPVSLEFKNITWQIFIQLVQLS